MELIILVVIVVGVLFVVRKGKSDSSDSSEDKGSPHRGGGGIPNREQSDNDQLK